MNALFSMAMYAGVTALLWLLWLAFRWCKAKTLVIITGLILAWGAWSTAMTYGPRIGLNSLPQTKTVLSPERVKVPTGDDIFNSEDQWERLNEKVEQAKARQEDEL